MKQVQEWAEKIIESVESVFFGKRETVERILAAVLCRGHVLIEDVPGVGKTVVTRAVAKSLGGKFAHIQCTPDLLPADVLGVSIFNQRTGEFVFRQGPVITNILLVDEINRATPRTQSALLEAMAEGQVSVEGKSVSLPEPFFLMATQSPTESEGTFPLPEVQKDRFFLSLNIGYPGRESESRLMLGQRKGKSTLGGLQPVTTPEDVIGMQKAVIDVHVEESIKDYILAIVKKTRNDSRLTLGVSPRGSLALYKGSQAMAALRGREYVVPEDVRDIVLPVLNKRILPRTEYVARGIDSGFIIRELLQEIEVPGYSEGAVT